MHVSTCNNSLIRELKLLATTPRYGEAVAFSARMQEVAYIVSHHGSLKPEAPMDGERNIPERIRSIMKVAGIVCCRMLPSNRPSQMG